MKGLTYVIFRFLRCPVTAQKYSLGKAFATAMRRTVPQSRRHLLAFASLGEARGKACCVPQGVEVMIPGGGPLRVGYFGFTIAEVLESFSCFLCQFERQHVGRQFSSQR